MSPSRTVLVLLAAAAAGCGAKPSAPGGAGGPGKGPPRGSPEEAFVKVRGALRAGDFGAIHDMLSEDARKKAEAEVEETASSAAAMGPLAREILGFDPAGLAGLSAREKYVRVMKGAYETNASLGSAFRPGRRESGLAWAEVAGASAEGDRATVTAKLPGAAATRTMAFVRESGAWRLAEPLSSRGGPPPEQAEARTGSPDEAPPAAPKQKGPGAPPGPAKR